MSFRLANSPDDLRAYIVGTANSSVYSIDQVEKDFWVTEVLRAVDAWSTADETPVVWKGGTTLSKAFNIIARFSEDVDITLLLDGHDVSEREQKLCSLVDSCASALGITPLLVSSERGQHRFARFPYASRVGSTSGVASEIRLEAGTLGGTMPSSEQTVSSFIASSKPAQESARSWVEFQPVTLRTLEPVRTLMEKLSILHNDAKYGSDERRRMTTRHYYDIYCLLQNQPVMQALTVHSAVELARDVAMFSASPGRRFAHRPKKGYQTSPAFDPWRNPVARDSYPRLVLQRLVPANASLRPSFEQCCQAVKSAQL